MFRRPPVSTLALTVLWFPIANSSGIRISAVLCKVDLDELVGPGFLVFKGPLYDI